MDRERLAQSAKKFLLVLLTIAGGAAVGWAVFFLPVQYGNIGIPLVRKISGSIFDLLGTGDFAYWLAFAIVVLVRNFIGYLLIGVATGIALVWIRYRRAFVYSILLAPAFFYVITAVAYERYPRYGDKQAFVEFAVGTAAMYSFVLLIAFCTWRLIVLARGRFSSSDAVIY